MPFVIRLLITEKEAVSNFILDDFENVFIVSDYVKLMKECENKEYRAFYLQGQNFELTTAINKNTEFVMISSEPKSCSCWEEILRKVDDKFQKFIEKDIEMSE